MYALILMLGAAALEADPLVRKATVSAEGAEDEVSPSAEPGSFAQDDEDDEMELKELLRQTEYFQRDIETKEKRMVKMIAETEQTAAETLVRLQQQGEQIKGFRQDQQHIDHNLEVANNIMDRMGGVVKKLAVGTTQAVSDLVHWRSSYDPRSKKYDTTVASVCCCKTTAEEKCNTQDKEMRRWTPLDEEDPSGSGSCCKWKKMGSCPAERLHKRELCRAGAWKEKVVRRKVVDQVQIPKSDVFNPNREHLLEVAQDRPLDYIERGVHSLREQAGVMREEMIRQTAELEALGEDVEKTRYEVEHTTERVPHALDVGFNWIW